MSRQGRLVQVYWVKPTRLVLVTVGLVLVVGLLAGCASGCPDALLEGTLTEQDGDLVVTLADGFVEPVDWPGSGYEVREDGDQLVVADLLGVKAREDDFVSLGGGEHETGVWRVCGRFEKEPIVGE